MASLVILFLTSLSRAESNPKPLVLPIRQDNVTKLLVANIYGRTPLVSVGFIVDLTAQHLWANCETNYKSSTFSEPLCGSAQCKEANTSYCFNCIKAARPFCHNNTCGRLLENPVTHQSTIGEVAQDLITFRSTDGSNPGPLVQIPNFLFTCSPSALVDLGLPKGVQGVAGLAQGSIALQNQLASRVGLKPIFTLCIPSTTLGNGLIFFGSDGPYTFSGIDASTNLIYTPIIISPFGGTTINTLLPYTILEGSIFKALISSYAKNLPNVATVKPIPPFGLCYESNNFPHSPLGPIVPSIDLELVGRGKVWTIYGVNSMVEAQPGVLCLAFVNGGTLYRASVNVGTYQMKDVPLQFDLSHLRLGIGYPLTGLFTRCQDFNFTITS